MINGLLPLSSLKRDEIYSFIAGIYVSVIWYLYFGNISLSLKSNGITLYNSCIFITVWLTSTVIIFLVQLYLSTLMSNSLQKYCEATEQDILLKILNLGKSRLNYFPIDYSKDLLIFIHIIGLAFTSSLLVLYPALSLLSFSIKYMSTFIVLQVILILLLLYQYHKFWLCNCAFASLRRKGRVEVYDEKKYGEEMSLALSKDNIVFNKEMDKITENDKLLLLIHFTEHNFSFIDDTEQPDGTVEWKWRSVIKINKTINMMHLKKHAQLEYILYDSDKFMLASSILRFDDVNKICIGVNGDENIECDYNEMILIFRDISCITKMRVPRVSFSSCKIIFV